VSNPPSDNILTYIIKGDIDSVNRLLDEGTDPNQKVVNQYPLIAAIKTGNIDIINLLLQRGADPTIDDNDPLIKTIESLYGFSRPDIIISLVKAGADPNAKIYMRGREGYMLPLLLKNKINNNNIIEKLLDLGANPDLKTEEGTPSLFYAFDMGDDIFNLFLDKGADINTTSSYNNNILSFAIARLSNLDKIRMIVERGVNVNQLNNNGDSALVAAIQGSVSMEVIMYLLDNGAIPDDKALIVALRENEPRLVKLFLERGASPFINEMLCPDEECRIMISETQWDKIIENVQKLSKQYSSKGNFQLPREVWELILLRSRQQKYCRRLGIQDHRYLLAYFAEYLDIPVTPATTKADLCELISKQLSYGGRYSENSVKYFKTREGRDKIFRTAMMLDIDPNQPFDSLMDQITEKLRI